MHLQNPLCISRYDNEVPPFAELELERLYGTIFSSLAHYRIYGGAENASTYVVRSGDDIVSLLLFTRDKNKVRVINESIRLGKEELDRFVDYIFTSFPSVSVIRFRAVVPDTGRFAWPWQTLKSSENYRISLPDDVDAYLARLGSATRKNIKRHKNKLERSFPSFRFDVYVRDEVSEQQLREIIRFNHARMATKGKVSTIDEAKTQALIRMVRERGFVTVATIDGRICGGAITLRIGDTCVSRVNAHDPAYDEHRLGMICCFMTVCEAIRRGAKHFDFLWGKYEYKSALLGVHYDLYDLVVYRSPWHQALHGRLALRIATINRLQKIKNQMLAMSASDAPPTLAGKCIGLVRAARQLPARLGASRHGAVDGREAQH